MTTFGATRRRGRGPGYGYGAAYGHDVFQLNAGSSPYGVRTVLPLGISAGGFGSGRPAGGGIAAALGTPTPSVVGKFTPGVPLAPPAPPSAGQQPAPPARPSLPSAPLPTSPSVFSAFRPKAPTVAQALLGLAGRGPSVVYPGYRPTSGRFAY